MANLDPETQQDLEHLLRASNHLKMAQSEFDMAKQGIKQRSAQK